MDKRRKTMKESYTNHKLVTKQEMRGIRMDAGLLPDRDNIEVDVEAAAALEHLWGGALIADDMAFEAFLMMTTVAPSRAHTEEYYLHSDPDYVDTRMKSLCGKVGE